MNKTRCLACMGYMIAAAASGYAEKAMAQTLPGAADPARIEPFSQEIPSTKPLPGTITGVEKEKLEAPDAAKTVTLTLKHIELEGVTAFSEEELADIYQPYLHQEITLDILWLIAGQITERYKQKGYFLSRAFVPAQEIEDGIAKIQVVEGYIAEVVLDDKNLQQHYLIEALIEDIKQQQPLNAYELESFILQLNALPAVAFRAVIEPIEDAGDGVTRLVLQRIDKPGTGFFSYDNFGSRFLGPYQATLNYQDSFLPLQQTTFSLLSSTPADELKYAALRHTVPFYPDLQFDVSANYVTAKPGSLLAANEITSDSADLALGVSWQPVRQRQENLILSMEISARNTNGDILGNNPLTRDRIRAVRGVVSYDVTDTWQGYNLFRFGLNQGVGILGANDAGDSFLSRAEANPEFTTAQFNYTRQQGVYENIMAIGRIAGQLASDPLYSAEEFGYGGQTFGRAYDPSELIGDHGIAAGIELYVPNMAQWNSVLFSPYSFYDIGKVWNEDTGGIDESASSAGFGIRINHTSGIAGNVGLAWPLTRSINTPIYGNGKNPRLLFQLSYGF